VDGTLFDLSEANVAIQISSDGYYSQRLNRILRLKKDFI
ncbi:unnamed protein product, partial [Adineta steineri]